MICYGSSFDNFSKTAFIFCNVCLFEDSLFVKDTVTGEFVTDQHLSAVCQGIDNITCLVLKLSIYTGFNAVECGSGYVILFKLRRHK
ncbi:MAG: hypothetical protein BWY95_00938 [Bacteroidetes bacterium ADurb.BinA104]|nr:MAG: hypothetical protein BWY95_00938 [Bacteroidetes bacterium ADurb.BinA104]